MVRTPLRVVIAVCGLGALGGLTACGLLEAQVGQGELEETISQKLEEEAGIAAESVDCPDALDADLDASVECTLTAPGGEEYGVTATITSVDGDQVEYDIEVDETPS